MRIARFWGEEFSNPNIQNDYDYFLTAAFTHLMLTRRGYLYDGILYPSVRSAGYGLNIAITPYAADNKLMLEIAGEGSIYKNGVYSYVEIEKIAELYENQTHYVYNNTNRITEGELLNKLNIDSLDELR